MASGVSVSTSSCISACVQSIVSATPGSLKRSVVRSFCTKPTRSPALPPPARTIDGDFVDALRGRGPLCCPADQALDTVRLLEGIAGS